MDTGYFLRITVIVLDIVAVVFLSQPNGTAVSPLGSKQQDLEAFPRHQLISRAIMRLCQGK